MEPSFSLLPWAPVDFALSLPFTPRPKHQNQRGKTSKANGRELKNKTSLSGAQGAQK